MNFYLSKKAAILSEKNQSLMNIKKLWRKSEGPFENVFRLISYGLIVLPGGMLLLLLEKLASKLWGMGLEDLGRKIDNALGKGPGSNVDEETVKQALEYVNDEAKKKEASVKQNGMVKEAGLISSIFKLLGGSSPLVKIVWGAFKWLMTAFAATSIADLYNKIEDTAETTLPIVNLEGTEEKLNDFEKSLNDNQENDNEK